MSSVKRARTDDGDSHIIGGHESARSQLAKPLVYSGSLDSFKNQDVTPIIGREFKGLQVRDLLKWGDEMIRDLAITSMQPLLPVLLQLEHPTNIPSLATRRRLPSRSGCHTK